jgi:hypothetical protein
MEESGSSPAQISHRLGDLNQVLQDWRENQVSNELLSGNPWDWRSEELDAYIERRRKEW